MEDFKLMYRKSFNDRDKKNDIEKWLRKNGWNEEEVEEYFEEFGLVMPGKI